MSYGGSAWLSLALGSELSGSDADRVSDAAFVAVDVLARGIAGARWLSAAPFDAIVFGMVLRDGPSEPPSFRVGRGELQIDSIVDARSLPADPSWWFLQRVQRILMTVADRYNLGDPPLRELDPQPNLSTGLPLPPVDRTAPADVGADVEALDDDELLVVVPYQQPGEDERAVLDRRLRVDAALTDAFGASPTASGATGNAYIFTFGMPRRGRRRR
jgi:hypothetical protein